MNTDMNTGRTFAECLIAMRATKGLSQVQASERCGVPRPTWNAWEAGRRVPAVYVQESILKRLSEI